MVCQDIDSDWYLKKLSTDPKLFTNSIRQIYSFLKNEEKKRNKKGREKSFKINGKFTPR